MIHAYDKNYLSKAQNNLASMLDFAVYDLEEDLSHFYRNLGFYTEKYYIIPFSFL